ncbi:glycosyltransferase family 4 protein [Pseudonocardia sp. K10HN5]|uniref:Glycosyltransferase family 4 protein n=1 Tax=Pseudonocardia acidicola TaxID=2724939 RepID=A0ABX1SG65_9PSEU|nr:glycosyltransferase family 4 protein [Pseudonocardia acidicola]
MRVLHVAQPTDAGVHRYVLAAVADQLARGWSVTVACPPGGRLAGDLTGLGRPPVHWPAARSPGPATAGEALRLARIVRRHDPDVVHLHSAKAGLAGRLAIRGRRPTLFQPHGWSWLAATGPTARAAMAWERVAARWAASLVCVGPGEQAQGRAAGIRGRWAVVHNGVDLAHFAPAGEQERAAARASLGVAPDVPLAVCLGRVTRQKGQDVLLDAWPAVRERTPRAELLVVGDHDAGPEAGRRMSTAPGVRWRPAVTDVRPVYAAADVVVLPSRWEGLSLTALEALASGRSLVASDIPGLAEIVSPGTGALVPPDHAGALAAAVAARLDDPDRALAEGARSRERAAIFDERRTLDELATLTLSIPGRTASDRAPRTSGSAHRTATRRAGSSR